MQGPWVEWMWSAVKFVPGSSPVSGWILYRLGFWQYMVRDFYIQVDESVVKVVAHSLLVVAWEVRMGD